MLVLAVLGRYVQWCNPAALLLKVFKRVEEPLMTALFGLQLLTVHPILYQATRMGSVLRADSLHGLKHVEMPVSCTLKKNPDRVYSTFCSLV